jgi:hypothetical protein
MRDLVAFGSKVITDVFSDVLMVFNKQYMHDVLCKIWASILAYQYKKIVRPLLQSGGLSECSELALN